MPELFKSTMGSPFTEGETAKVVDAWIALLDYVDTLPTNSEPVDMLDSIAEVILKCYEVRRAINDGFYYSNKRQDIRTRHTVVGFHKPPVLPKALADLKPTEEEMAQVMAFLGKDGKP